MSAFNCNACNVPNASNAKYCTNCGASLMKAAESPYQSPVSSEQGALVSEYAFAGFWKRFIAYLFDTIIFVLLFAILIAALGGSLLSMTDDDPSAAFGVMGIYLLYYPAWWLYFALMESSSAQATLGKKILGIKVTDRTGQPISFGQATGRHFGALITQMTLTIGYLMAGFTARKQALHDLIAGTLVVNKRYGPSQIKTASENPGSGMAVGGIIAVVFVVLLIPVGGILAAIAIPAYQDYTMRANVHQAMLQTESIQSSIEEYASQSGYWPNTLEQTGIQQEQYNTQKYQILLAAEGSYFIVFKQPESLAQGRVRFVPELSSGGDYKWDCSGQDIKQQYLPPACRQLNN